MKAAAFKLVAFVVGFQLFLTAGVMAACLFTQDKRCTGEKSTELLTAIGVQAFALYAAEK